MLLDAFLLAFRWLSLEIDFETLFLSSIVLELL